MVAANIQKFDEIAGRIFAELYGSFPVPQPLYSEDYLGSETKWDETFQEHYPVDKGEFFVATAIWLKQAGYLTAEEITSYQVVGAVLTAKGLEVLRAVPDTLKDKRSIGEQLTSAAKAGGAETMRGLLSEALGIGARLLSPLVGLTT